MRRALVVATVTGILALTGCSAGGTLPALKQHSASVRTHDFMGVSQACEILNATQARYGMSGARGRAALRLVAMRLASTGRSGRINGAATGGPAHPPRQTDS